MTENEVIKRLNTLNDALNEQCFDADENSEALQDAIEAIEEVQQYRAIEKELKERYHANIDIPLLMQHFIETIFEGEKHEGFCILTNEDAKAWEEYQAIGTPEECRAAMEKQKPMAVTEKSMLSPIGTNIGRCPVCLEMPLRESDNMYCPFCGQKLDWGERRMSEEQEGKERMSDLIRRKDVAEFMFNNRMSTSINNAYDQLKCIPTAHDPEKVVEQLEKLKKAEQDRSDDCDEDGYGDSEQIYDDGRSQGRYEAYVKAAEIVKGGGVDEV